MLGFGPVARLARALRRVYEQAGRPPLERMRLGPSSSTANLSRAKNGQVMPTWECVEAFLRGCDVTGGETYHDVLRIWEETAAAAAAFRPDLANCETEDDLVDALLALAAGQGLTVDGRLDTAVLARRLVEAAGSVIGETKKDRKKWTVRPVPEPEMVAEFVDRARPPTEPVLDHVVFACGGIDGDVRYWRKHLARIHELRRKDHLLAEIGSPLPASPPRVRLLPETTAPAIPAPRRPEPVPSIPAPVPSAPAPSPVSPSPVPPRWAGIVWTRRRVLGAVAGAAGVALAGAGGVLLAVRGGDRETPAAPTTPSSPPVGSGAPVLPETSVRHRLHHLADLVRQGSDAPATGRYAYTRIQFWSRETTPAGRDGALTVEEERLWWAEDLSGLRIVIRTDRGAEVRTSDPSPPGGMTIVVRYPSVDPTILAGQLDAEQPHAGPVGRLRAVASVNMFHPLDRQQRAAVLTVLAETEGLSYRGAMQDQAGRDGIAISADVVASGPVRERVTLMFSTTTGELLSQETSRLPGPGGPDPAYGATSDYTLFLERSRTNRRG
ncbi:hypothetical protein V1634_06935 [Plantactinospora veratri]|uniref:Uncharacterized protein n=1 Tax=Plantactinospora veratri TaxID=1436122 RepID=A0ABU7S9D7_9ACTN